MDKSFKNLAKSRGERDRVETGGGRFRDKRQQSASPSPRNTIANPIESQCQVNIARAQCGRKLSIREPTFHRVSLIHIIGQRDVQWWNVWANQHLPERLEYRGPGVRHTVRPGRR